MRLHSDLSKFNLVHPIKMKIEIDDPLTYKIIGCSMSVHRQLGNGFQEVIYQRSLAIEFRKQNIQYERELEMPIFYDEIEIGSRRVIKLEPVHLAQGLNYLKAYDRDLGLLINFGGTSLEFKRLFRKQNPVNL